MGLFDPLTWEKARGYYARFDPSDPMISLLTQIEERWAEALFPTGALADIFLFDNHEMSQQDDYFCLHAILKPGLERTLEISSGTFENGIPSQDESATVEFRFAMQKLAEMLSARGWVDEDLAYNAKRSS